MQAAHISGGQDCTISREQWEAHRETIRDLYVSQGLPLKIIRQHLLKHHSFSASEQQYKRKFKEWEYSKNLKGSVCRAIGSSLERRGLTSDTAKATVGGVVLTPARLKRALRRHNVPSLERKWKMEQRARTPDAVEIQSSEPCPVGIVKFGGVALLSNGQRESTSEREENTRVEVGPGDVVPNLILPGTVANSTRNPAVVVFQSGPPRLTTHGLDQPSTINTDLPFTLQSGPRLNDIGLPREGGGSLHPLDVSSWKVPKPTVSQAVGSSVVFLQDRDVSPQIPNDPTAPGLISTTAYGSQFNTSVSEYEILVHEGAKLNLPIYHRPDCFMHTIDELFLNEESTERDTEFILSTCCFLNALHLTIRWKRFGLLKALLISGIGPAALPMSSPWVLAVWKGYSEAFSILATHSAVKDMDVKIYFGPFDHGRSGQYDFMQLASVRGHCHLIPTLVEAGLDVNGRALGPRGRTALQFAVERGDQNMTLCLLENGANINAACADDRGLTALQAAAIKGDKEMVSLLLDHGSDVNGKPSLRNGYTALSAAIEVYSFGVLDLLLRRGADVNLIEWEGCDRSSINILVAARKGGDRFVRSLLDAGLHLETVLSTGGTLADLALSEAARHQRLTVLLMILAQPVVVSVHVLNMLSATLKLRWNTDSQVIRELLNKSADFDHEPTSVTLLVRACRAGNWRVVNCLIRQGAQIDLPSAFLSDHGQIHIRTPLQAACEHGNEGVVRGLLNLGARINAPAYQKYGYTALQAAAARGDVRLVRMLLHRGADVNAPGAPSEGMTALQVAVKFDYLELTRMLLEAGADIASSSSTIDGYTSIDWAASGGRLEMLKILLQSHKSQKRGVLSAVCTQAATHAKTAGHFHVVEFLEKFHTEQRLEDGSFLPSVAARPDSHESEAELGMSPHALISWAPFLLSL